MRPKQYDFHAEALPMRYIAALTIMLLAVMFLTAVPYTACSENQVGIAKKTDVKVALAVVEGYQTTKSALHIIIENISDKPQRHFEEWNSWGYGNLTLEWTDANGKTGNVAKVPGSWDRNGPSTVILEPGEALVREITFDSKLWHVWPAIAYGTKLRLKVTYRSAGRPDADGWTGEVHTQEKTVTFR
jgi:hypothetical protein